MFILNQIPYVELKILLDFFIYNVYVKTLSILLIGDPLGQTTLDSRLRYDSYSPHHQLTMTASGHHLRSGGDSGTVLGHQNINGSPCRSPGGVDNNFTKIDSHNRLGKYYL